MLKKLLIKVMLLVTPLNLFNGYHQTTRIEIDGINETCYGTLLSKTSISGNWDSQMPVDFDVSEEVSNAFSSYQDKDNYFYLNFIQDVSGGLLYWPSFPPENFKLLLYFPDSDTYIVSDKPLTRYALCSTYKASIENGILNVERDYDYLRMFLNTACRIILGIIVSILIALLYGKPQKEDTKFIYITNILFHIIINVLISIYSFKNGFSIVEYIIVMLIPYILLVLIQGFLYSTKSTTISGPYYCALFSNIGAYVLGLALVDFIPSLFTII